MQDAQDVQDVAIECLGGTPLGYTLSATTSITSRLLSCSKPIMGKLLDEFVYQPNATLRLPYGALGIGAQFIFVIGSPLTEPASMRSVSQSIISCRMGLQLLGRRVATGFPLNDWSATADFALDVGCVIGAEVEGWQESGVHNIEVSLRMGANEVARGCRIEAIGNPVGAVLGLALSLQARGATLHAGDVVATGSCTGLTQVVAGQSVQAAFGDRGVVETNLA